MSIILIWLKSKVLGNSLSWIFIGIIVVILLVIIIPNLDTIRERLGFETRTSLKVLTIEQAQIIQDIQTSNASLVDSVIVSDAVRDVTNRVMVKEAIAVQQSIAVVTHITQTKRAAIRKIHATRITHPSTPRAIATAISKAQITAIWDTYHTYNPGTPT
jgi:hypothetical protein